MEGISTGWEGAEGASAQRKVEGMEAAPSPAEFTTQRSLRLDKNH